MKVLLALCLGLLALVGQGYAADCHCGLFLSSEDGEKLLLNLPPFEVPHCDNHNICKMRCTEEYDNLTGSGDLNFVMTNGLTVAETICQEHPDLTIKGENVYVYHAMLECDMPWMYNGEEFSEPLCCNAGTSCVTK
ncbi:uncharacterized protein LOC143034137 [Oratosquilla oratoria]|uniref:uncharacterized protein LOC143034137 n=1 Tax=Oratosquilla oratoria TaxID=337810 RepID=UPI003F77427F